MTQTGGLDDAHGGRVTEIDGTMLLVVRKGPGVHIRIPPTYNTPVGGALFCISSCSVVPAVRKLSHLNAKRNEYEYSRTSHFHTITRTN
jgi:hypothetical protein